MREYQAKRLLNEKFLLGEGPFYDNRKGVLTWVDIKTGTLHGLEPDGKRFQIQTGQYLGAAVPVKNSDSYLGVMTTGLYWIDRDGIQKQYSLEKEFRDFQRANDAKCDPKGRLWFESMPLFPKYMECGGNVYCYTTDRGCERKIHHTSVANGMAWSVEKKRFYFVDSGYRKVYAYDCDILTGAVSDPRTILTFQTGIPDGMTIDRDGMLWIAVWGQGYVGRFDPETGAMTELIKVPARQVSSCCFGGADRDILYITSSSEGMYGEEDGCVFSCRVDTPGEENVCFCPEEEAS